MTENLVAAATSSQADSVSWTEEARQAALRRYELTGLESDAVLDGIVQAAARICNTPIAAVTIVDDRRVLIKSSVGLARREFPREHSFCTQALLTPEPTVLSDIALDRWYRDHPMVCGDPHLRFYAGVPLNSPEGLPLGMLCVLDHRPRPEGLAESDLQTLRVLARAAMTHFELLRTTRQAVEHERRLQEIIDAIPQKIWICRADGLNEYYNHRWYQFVGEEQAAAVGHHWDRLLHPEDRDRVLSARHYALQKGTGYEIEYRLRHHTGQYRWVLARAHPVLNRWGKVDRWYGTATDIHRTKLAELSVLESQQRYRALIAAGASAVWLADAAGLIVQGWGWNEFADDHPNSFLGLGWIAALHPDDAERVKTGWHTSRSNGDLFESEFRILREHRYQWVSVRAVNVVNNDGTIREWIGTIHDIHARKQAEETQQANLGRLRLALDAGRMVGWEFDTLTGLFTCSSNAPELFGFGSGSLGNFLARVHVEDQDKVMPFFSKSRESDEPTCEFRFTLPCGTDAWIEMRAERINPTQIVGIMFDVTERKRAIEEMQWMANHDPLTGLPNRRAFDETFELYWRQAARERTVISLLVIDADHFKQYNDTYGHAAGDELLRAIGSAIMAGIRRPLDLAARIGGEEFVVLLPETDEAGARSRAEAIRETVWALAAEHRFNPGGVATVSIGSTSVLATLDIDKEHLLIAADDAMYEAKSRGRNCVCWAPLVIGNAEAAKRLLDHAAPVSGHR